MASDALKAFKDELEAQLAVIEPTLEGFQELARHEISSQLRQVITEQVTFYKQRIEDIKATLVSLDTLESHGYPGLSFKKVSLVLINELNAEASSIGLAIGTFVPVLVVTALRFTAGLPEPKG